MGHIGQRAETLETFLEQFGVTTQLYCRMHVHLYGSVSKKPSPVKAGDREEWRFESQNSLVLLFLGKCIGALSPPGHDPGHAVLDSQK